MVWLCSSCAFRQSAATRAASFHPHAGHHIGPVDIETFLHSRVAVLVSSAQDPSNKWASGDTRLPLDSNLGCAVAVDPRGYFLTAAHCLKHEVIYLLLFEAQTARALRARVVSRGSKQSDLAILHVRQTLSQTFDWAGAIRKDDPAMAVGLSWSKTRLTGLELLGGKILGYRDLEDEVGDLRVASNVPLQSGDSGGPLVDAGGRLIGINTRGTPPLVHKLLPNRVFPMATDRPNQKWLSETIEADVATHWKEHAQPKSAKTNRPPASPLIADPPDRGKPSGGGC